MDVTVVVVGLPPLISSPGTWKLHRDVVGDLESAPFSLSEIQFLHARLSIDFVGREAQVRNGQFSMKPPSLRGLIKVNHSVRKRT